MLRFLLCSIFVFISITSSAQELFQIPLSKQLSESNAIIMGTYQGSFPKKLSDGSVVTNVSFKLEKSVGLGSRQLLNKNSFSFVYDGGTWQGIDYPNKLKPRFVVGRRYIVLLRKGEYDFYPLNERLGVYNVIGRNGEDAVISQAFPDNPKFGANSFSTFNLWISSIYGEGLKGIGTDKDIFHKKTAGRKIASVDNSRESSEYKIHIYWLALLFGLLGAAQLRKSKV